MTAPTFEPITIITATVNHPFLTHAVESVRAQVYPEVEHVIVVDGPEFERPVRKTLERIDPLPRNLHVFVLPKRTGANGWCSHRIVSGLPFLLDSPYVAYLDQDNWYEPDHLTSLMTELERTKSPASYSLRRIFDQARTFICNDECQSLGTLHNSFDTPGRGHIDSNCWLLSHRLATQLAAHWLSPKVGDRKFARQVMKAAPNIPCTMRHSLNYVAGSRSESAPQDYFLRGNALMRSRYPSGLPWDGTTVGDASGA